MLYALTLAHVTTAAVDSQRYLHTCLFHFAHAASYTHVVSFCCYYFAAAVFHFSALKIFPNACLLFVFVEGKAENAQHTHST